MNQLRTNKKKPIASSSFTFDDQSEKVAVQQENTCPQTLKRVPFYNQRVPEKMRLVIWSALIVPIAALSLGDLVAQPILTDEPVRPVNSESEYPTLLFKYRQAEVTATSSTAISITLKSDSPTSTTEPTELQTPSTPVAHQDDQRTKRIEQTSLSADLAAFMSKLLAHSQATWATISPVQPHCYIALAAILLALGNCVCLCLHSRRRQTEYLLPIVPPEPALKSPEAPLTECELPLPPLPAPVEAVECCETCKAPYGRSLASL